MQHVRRGEPDAQDHAEGLHPAEVKGERMYVEQFGQLIQGAGLLGHQLQDLLLLRP